jgi:hypothetical protein
MICIVIKFMENEANEGTSKMPAQRVHKREAEAKGVSLLSVEKIKEGK